MFSRKRQMTIGPDILNLSKLFWTEEAGADLAERSTFVAVDYGSRIKKYKKFRYFLICCGDVPVEDGITGNQNYLAVVRKDGSYTLKKLEPYLEVREEKLVLDLWKLPDEMNGMKFRKLPAGVQGVEAGRMYLRWGRGTFCAQDAGRKIWYLEERS